MVRFSWMAVRGDILNLSSREPGCDAPDLGSMLTVTVMLLRALEGSRARKFRAVLPERALNGEKEVVTDVRNLVIIVSRCANKGMSRVSVAGSNR